MSAHHSAAKTLAERGFRVFPLVPDGKTPAIKRWPERATTDPADIDRMWRDPIFGTYKDYGVGVATGQGLVVLDVDFKSNGYESLAQLELDNGPFDGEFLRVRTAGGGLHIYMRVEGSVANSVSKIAPGIDVRGDGGYVVGPGTTIDGKTYQEVET